MVRTRGSDAEHRSGAGFAGIRVSTWIHIRNAFVAAEYSMSVSRNAHLLMRSPPHERVTYVALPTRFALTGRGLRIQHHITGKTTFRTGLPPWVTNGEAHRQLLVHDQASGTRSPGAESGACVALPCSPRSSPLAPPARPPFAQVCSPASVLL